LNKLSRKYYTLVFGIIMGFIMSVLTSLAVTIINIGIVHNFFEMWSGIFLTTFAIGSMTIMITPFAKNITDRITISEAAK
jgi:putative Mn2+ efflux pump MntP